MPAAPDPTARFTWRDGERTIHFGDGLIGDAPALLGGDEYTLLTTERAARAAPAIQAGATAVHLVPAGPVDEIAAGMREAVQGELLVALGGGRVIDVARALAAADPPRRVAAIPTTLSAAEMTTVHRHTAGVAPETPRVRPAVVINDPRLCASQPERSLAASAANALAHAAEAPLTTLRNPVSTLAALRAAELLTGAFAGDAPDRGALALGALLAGYSIDSAFYGLHHVLAQTAVRHAGAGHGPANAILLPHTLRALEGRFPDEIARFAQAVGGDAIAAAAALASRAGATRLREEGVTEELIGECADAALGRVELELTPPPPDRAELVAIYEAAW